MADLPPEFGFGLATGGFQLAVGDRDDAGRHPDAIPDTGTVTFRPQAARIVIPGRRIVTPRAIETKLDAAGYLYLPESVTPGEDGRVAEEDRGVYLVANDTTDATPQDWTYEVTVSLTGQSQWRFPIAVTTGSEQDISSLVPVDSSGGTPIIRGPKGDPGADGIMASIVAGDGIAVDATDPANPVVSADVAQDTGWRDVSSLLINGWTQAATRRARLRRYGAHVQIAFYLNPTAATDPICFELPAGFRDYDATGSWVTPGGTAAGVAAVQRTGNAVTLYAANTQSANVFCSIDLMTTDPWPTLPGTPA